MYRNHEHYPDPTYAAAYSSIKKSEKPDNYIPWVYICSPLRGNVAENINNAKRYSRFAATRGRLPMTPHLYFTQFLDDTIPSERTAGMKLALNALCRCREVWVFGDIISEGMANEIRIAEKRNIPIRYFTDKCEEVI